MEVKPGFPGLFIGTSGWSYKHWQGVFYPEGVTQDRYLEHYLTQFDCVELNASFYHLPLKTTVAGWVRRTPADFRFCTKLSRYITHQKYLVDVEEALKNYFTLFARMKLRLGPVLVQLPPGLAYDEELFSRFVEMLRLYPQFRIAVEVRHSSWLRDEFFQILRKEGIAFVIADSGGQFPFAETVTSDFVYLRFHGRELLYASNYSEEELNQYADKIVSWLKEGKEVWAFFNNDYAGFAPFNAMQLREMVCAKV